MSRQQAGARGFSLVELVVVFIILSISVTLLAYVGSNLNDDSEDATANASLDRVINAERDWAQQRGSYTGSAAEIQKRVGREITVLAAEEVRYCDTTRTTQCLTTNQSRGAREVVITVGSKGTLGVAVRSETGSCFLRRVERVEDGGETTPVEADAAQNQGCSAAAALPAGESVGRDESAVGG